MENGNRYIIPENATIRRTVKFKGDQDEDRVLVTKTAGNLAKAVYGENFTQHDVEVVAYTIFAIDQSPENTTGGFTIVMAERVLRGRDDLHSYYPNGLPVFNSTSQNGDLVVNIPQELSEAEKS